MNLMLEELPENSRIYQQMGESWIALRLNIMELTLSVLSVNTNPNPGMKFLKTELSLVFLFSIFQCITKCDFVCVFEI